MKNLLLILTIIFTTTLISCSSGDDNDNCMKTITIPQFYTIGNQTYTTETTQEVPCNFEEISDPVEIAAPSLENFNYEVLNFIYIPDTGNNTSRLEFEIRLDNPNEYDVSGVPILTMLSDGLQTSGSYSNNAIVPCYEISANSSCILTYSQESSHDIGILNSIELVSVQYYVTN